MILRSLMIVICCCHHVSLMANNVSASELNHVVNTQKLPLELKTIQDSAEKKRLFIAFLKPLIHAENAKILNKRDHLKEILSQNKPSKADAVWLNKRCDEYLIYPCELQELSLRLDIIPVSLALAQSAAESGWGSSRFAQEGNALFGQWVAHGQGMDPKHRDHGKSHQIGTFNSPKDSIKAYMKNLNTHRAYHDFRHQRANMRKQKILPNGYQLANTLLYYSERKELYVNLIKDIIKTNHLNHDDG